jgi:hypothetical protein
MAGLLGYAAAGALSGYGKGIVDEAKARREEALRELEHSRLMQREQMDRDFRSSENEKSRQFQASENEKTRTAQGDVMTLEDGTAALRQGSTVTPITGEGGKPVKTLRKTSESTPADVQTAEWLVSRGVAKDVNEAWSMVRRTRENPEGGRAAIFKAFLSALKPEFGNVDGAKLQEEAQRLTEQTMRFLEQGSAPQQSAPSAAPPPAISAPKDTGTGKGGRYPEAPRDPAQRKTGQVYTAPNGKKGRWMGTGWQPVD